MSRVCLFAGRPATWHSFCLREAEVKKMTKHEASLNHSHPGPVKYVFLQYGQSAAEFQQTRVKLVKAIKKGGI